MSNEETEGTRTSDELMCVSPHCSKVYNGILYHFKQMASTPCASFIARLAPEQGHHI